MAIFRAIAHQDLFQATATWLESTFPDSLKETNDERDPG